MTDPTTPSVHPSTKTPIEPSTRSLALLPLMADWKCWRNVTEPFLMFLQYRSEADFTIYPMDADAATLDPAREVQLFHSGSVPVGAPMGLLRALEARLVVDLARAVDGLYLLRTISGVRAHVPSMLMDADPEDARVRRCVAVQVVLAPGQTRDSIPNDWLRPVDLPMAVR
jgi:hypothetical protein